VVTPSHVSSFAAVLLAGGTGARMSGADKAAIELDGRTLLEHALDAVVDAVEVVVVGDPVPTHSLATFVREDPAYGGPAAALLTGLGQLLSDAPTVVVLAVDMPRVNPHTLRRLRVEMGGHDGAALVDGTGRRQLAMALDIGAVKAAAPPYEVWHGLALRALLADLDIAEVPAEGDEARDVDTWADLRDLRG
jgi:molybdopterin-guanine dinucleotide biosynthesis protein A